MRATQVIPAESHNGDMDEYNLEAKEQSESYGEKAMSCDVLCDSESLIFSWLKTRLTIPELSLLFTLHDSG